jgi:hypothetical protein
MCELIHSCLILVVTSSRNRADPFDDVRIDQNQSGGCRAGDFVRSQLRQWDRTVFSNLP